MRLYKKILICVAAVMAMGYLIPYSFRNPVEGATRNDYNQESFWYYPWGTSITHKGVDIATKVDNIVYFGNFGIPSSEIESEEGYYDFFNNLFFTLSNFPIIK
ncbi:MAG: hypothetical protein K2I44_05550 [Muribaculaceae bacterium]|nr:hypothetical protein [Muribaculaceae bacterium]